MDNSGISVHEKREMYIGDKTKSVTGPVVTGGEIRLAAQSAGIDHGVDITDMASLRKISVLISKGSSLWNAADDVAREYAFMERGENTNHGERPY